MQFVGYHFDAFRYERGPSRWSQRSKNIYTFDYQDAREHNLPVVELFSSLRSAVNQRSRRFDLSAIMRNHSERLIFLDMVMRAVQPRQYFIHIFESSALTAVFNFLRHPRLYIKYLPHISRKSLPYEEYSEILAASQLTVDYAHPSQTGITIRCFEAINVGTRIITNNASTLQCPLFAKNSVVVLSLSDDLNGFAARLADAQQAEVVPKRRSVEDFLLELLDRDRATPSMAQNSQSKLKSDAHSGGGD